MTDLWIYLIAVIIYAVAYVMTDGQIANRRGFGRYGTWGMQADFSLDFDPLEDIRQNYNERLQSYYVHNKPNTYLINKNCEARLITSKNGNISFYVKERTTYNKPGRYFEVSGNKEHASTMWAIIDMEFNELTRFQDIKQLYSKLNQGFETRGGMKYYKVPFLRKLPKPTTNQCAQNEFCRIKIETLNNGEKVLICSEIWGENQYDKRRQFIIKGDKLILYGILSEFIKNKNKLEDYITLLTKYITRQDCTVNEIPLKEDDQNINISKERNQPETENKPEEIKYIHVDIKETPSEAAKKVIKRHCASEKQEEEKSDKNISTEEQEYKEIKKFDERNLDI